MEGGKAVTKITSKLALVFISLLVVSTVVQGQTTDVTSISLSHGWNFISLPKQPPNTEIGAVLSDLSGSVEVVWGYDNQTKGWLKWKPRQTGNTLTAIIPGHGYWVYMASPGFIDMTGWSAAATGVQLYPGWNLIGYIGESGLPVSTALAGIIDNWTIMWTWENGAWSAAAYMNVPLPVQPLENLNQGRAYWVKAAGAADVGWKALPPEARGAAEALLVSVDVSPASRVLFAGPVEPGTILMESDVPGEQAQFRVPDTPGSYYVFFIDDEPGSKFNHPVRFSWVDSATRDAGFISAGNRMTIYRPNKTPAPFKQIAMETIGGIQFSFMEGEGAVVPADISSKPVVEPGTLTQLQNESQPLSVRYPEGTAAEKLALVIDAGDARGWYSIAADLYTESEGVASWLRANNFYVFRISQYWSSPYAYIPTVTSGPEKRQDLDLTKLRAHVQWFVDRLKTKGPASSGVCDEFFLYIQAHGAPDAGRAGNFSIYPADGTDNPSRVDMMSIFEVLKNLPHHVKVTIFLDACYSGMVYLKNERMRKLGGYFMEQFCSNHCGLTVMTSASATATSPASTIFGRNSSTVEFMKGASLDNDGDGKVGTIKDRWMEMRKNTASGANPPNPFVCPEQQSWCSLDQAPTQIPPPPVSVAIDITSPTTQDIYTTPTPTVDLAGTVSGSDFTGVTWKSSKGDSGTAQENTQGTGNWSIRGIALEPGENAIIVTATAGTVSMSDTIKVVYPVPKVKITTPSNTGSYTMTLRAGHSYTYRVRAVMEVSGDTINDFIWENSLGGSGVLSPGSPFDVQLQTGNNTITVKARDTAGNVVSEDQSLITSLLQPIVSIVSPAKDPKPVTDKSTITISGTAYDPYSRIRFVKWENQTTGARGEGVRLQDASGGWTASVALKSGDNQIVITALSGNDLAGGFASGFPLASDTITVTYNAPPISITITSPTDQDTYQTYKATVDLAGTTANVPPASTTGNVVEWKITNGDYNNSGKVRLIGDAWSATGIALRPGINVITVGVLEDYAPSYYATDTVTVTYAPPPLISKATGYMGLEKAVIFGPSGQKTPSGLLPASTSGFFGLDASKQYAAIAHDQGVGFWDLTTQREVLYSPFYGQFYGLLILHRPTVIIDAASSMGDVLMGYGPNGTVETNWNELYNGGDFGMLASNWYVKNVWDAWTPETRSGEYDDYDAYLDHGTGSVYWENRQAPDMSKTVYSTWFPGAKGFAVSGQGGFNGKALIVTADAVNKAELWWGNPYVDTAAAKIGDLGAGSRKIRCLSGLCGITNYADNTMTIVSWPAPDQAPQIFGYQQVGNGPVGVALRKNASGDMLAVTTGYNDNTFTITNLGNDGAVKASTTTALEGCNAPGHGEFLSDTQVLITCNKNGAYIISPLP